MKQHATVTALPTRAATIDPTPKCEGRNTDIWFPHEPNADRPTERAEYEEYARSVCGDCPFRAQCLMQALTDEAKFNVQSHGIFGGRAPWERVNMIRDVKRRGMTVEESIDGRDERELAVAS